MSLAPTRSLADFNALLNSPLSRKSRESPPAEVHAQWLISNQSFKSCPYQDQGIGRDDDVPAALSHFMLEQANLQIQSFPMTMLEDRVETRTIGQGTDYIVDICRSNDGHLVAVKHAKLGHGSDDKDAEKVRWIRKALLEIRIMSYPPIAKCQNVLGLKGYSWSYINDMDHFPALVVEFAALGNLRGYIQRKAGLPDENQKWNILLGIVNGLLHIHFSGIVHGDIKMENILVTTTEDGEVTTKISDFGGSIVTSRANSTGYGGTDIYNAPEVRLSTLNTDDSNELLYCDIWALGLLALEITLDGECYLNKEVMERFEQRRMEGFERACCSRIKDGSIQEPEKFSKLTEFINKALSRTPKDRGSIDELDSILTGYFLPFSIQKVPYNPTYGTTSGIIDLTHVNSYFAFLHNRRHGGFSPDKPPWSVQVAIAKRYEELITSSVQDMAGFAHINLALCHYVGCGVERNIGKVSQHIHAAALLGRPDAYLLIHPLSECLGFEVDSKKLETVEPSEFDDQNQVMRENRKNVPYRSAYRELAILQQKTILAEFTFEPNDLHSAAILNKIEIVRKLLQTGEVDRPDDNGRTALLTACMFGNFESAKLLLQNGSDPSLAGPEGWTPLHLLIRFADADIDPLCSLMQESSPAVDVNAVTEVPSTVVDYWDCLYGTPLQHAVTARNIPAVRALLNMGADPTFGSNGPSPIQIASSLFLADILELLLEKSKSADGLFCLNEAHPFRPIMIHGKGLSTAIRATIKLLMNIPGLDPNSFASSPLDQVASANYSLTDVTIARELIPYFKDKPDDTLSTIQTGLLGCAGVPMESHTAIASLLIDAGYSLRIPTFGHPLRRGWNAMHWAASGRSLKLVRQMYERDPELLDIKTADDEGLYPLHVAATSFYGLDMIKLLLELEADPCKFSGEDMTALAYFLGEMRPRLDTQQFDVLLKANAMNGYVIQEGGITILHMIVIRSAMMNLEGEPGYEMLGSILTRPEILALLNKPTDDGYVPLHYACITPDYTTLRMLFEAGADIKYRTPAPDSQGPLSLVLDGSGRPKPGLGGSDNSEKWDNAVYRAASFLAECSDKSAQEKLRLHLRIAAYCGCVEEVKRLVECKERIEFSESDNELTPLQLIQTRLKRHGQTANQEVGSNDNSGQGGLLNAEYLAKLRQIVPILINYDSEIVGTPT